MRELDRHDDVRAFLSRMAEEAPVEPVGLSAAVRRAHRRIAVTWVGAAVAVSLAIGGVALAWEHADEAWMPRPADPAPVYSAEALPSMVLASRRDVTRTLGTQGIAGRLKVYRPQDVTPGFLQARFSLSAEGLTEAGMRTGYIGWYGTPGFGEREGGTSLVSIAMLFPDADAARRGLDVIGTSGERTWTVFRRTPTVGLGEEGWIADGRLWGRPGLAVVWRTGNVIEFIASQGNFSRAEFLTLAEALDRRARSFA